MQELSEWRVEQPPWGEVMAWDLPGEIIRQSQPYSTHETWQQFPNYEDPRFRQEFEALIQQSDAFLKHCGYKREGGRYRVIEPNQLRIGVFSHNGLGLTWLAHLLEIPLTLMWSGFWPPPSSVTTVLFEERSADWAVPRCLGLGDVAHLYADRLPVQPRGLKGNFH